MYKYQALDTTPHFTFSTLQTSSETANAIIVTILTSFVITSFSQLITRLVFLTHQDTFHFESWLRVHIFYNGDDVFRMIRWMFGLSPEINSQWNRDRPNIRWDRLKWPMFAKAALFLSTIGSIIIAIPRERHMTPCDSGDFHLYLSAHSKGNSTIRNGRLAHCDQVPLISSLGQVRSTLQICKSRYRKWTGHTVPASIISSNTPKTLVFHWERFGNKETGLLDISMIEKENSTIVSFSWEALWKANPENDSFFQKYKTRNFRTPFPQPERGALQNLTELVEDSMRANCSSIEKVNIKKPYQGEYMSYGLNCDENISSALLLGRLEAWFSNRIKWEKKSEISNRIPVMTNDVGKAAKICPIHVSVERPIANMLPLFILLIVLMVVNLITSWILRNRSSVLDEVFIFMKDILGHDMTANPLQVSDGQLLRLKKSKCGKCGNLYVGYLQWCNSSEVADFGDQRVSACICDEKVLANKIRP